MKTRAGLVSNSSSSCFILDRRDKEVQKLVDKCVAGRPLSLDRGTAIAVGPEAIGYAKNFIAEDGHWYDEMDESNLGSLILRYAKELGEENVVFIRRSDEDMGGELFPEDDDLACYWKRDEPEDPKNAYYLLRKLALTEVEYH